MKKSVLVILALTTLFSCKKTAEKSTETTAKTEKKVAKEQSNAQETKQQFKDNEGNLYAITYTFEKNQPVAIVASKDFTTTLNQSDVWAKGAEYKSGDYKLISKGGNVQLFIKGKEVSLTLTE